MSAFESRVSFQETSKFYSLALRRVLTKSDHLPARLLCAGVSALRSTQPSQIEVFPCSVCVWMLRFFHARVHSMLGSLQDVDIWESAMGCHHHGYDRAQTESSESIFMPKLLWAPWKKSSPPGLTAQRMDRQTDKILMFIKGGHA